MAALRAPKLTIFNVLVNIIFIKSGTTLIFGMVLDYQGKILLGLLTCSEHQNASPRGPKFYIFNILVKI